MSTIELNPKGFATKADCTLSELDTVTRYYKLGKVQAEVSAAFATTDAADVYIHTQFLPNREDVIGIVITYKGVSHPLTFVNIDMVLYDHNLQALIEQTIDQVNAIIGVVPTYTQTF